VSDKIQELVGLGARLLVASPKKWDEMIARVRAFVEAQETIARADGLLILRPDRPNKRYQA